MLINLRRAKKKSPLENGVFREDFRKVWEISLRS
jgi:hypothetical protein